MASVTDKTARKSFKVAKRGNLYDVECLICASEFRAWSWLRNALNRGYGHAWTEHNIDSPRGRWIGSTHLFGGKSNSGQ